jgi:polyisoprenoid-binding protein YceI
MRVGTRWKLIAFLLLLGLTGCALRPHALAPGVPGAVAPHLGVPYEVVPGDSLVTILVFRAGALASAGHNHVIASHDLSGTVYVASELMRSSFQLHLPVATLTVDEAALRAQQASADFPPEVPDSAKEGTRHNMLSEALLDAAHSPEILLEAGQLEKGSGEHTVTAHVECTVRGTMHAFTVPVSYQPADGSITLTGSFALRQSDLGLTPFSALLGALQVQDEMHLSFRIVARAMHRG